MWCIMSAQKKQLLKMFVLVSFGRDINVSITNLSECHYGDLLSVIPAKLLAFLSGDLAYLK